MQHGDEMFLESPNRAFSEVLAMIVGGDDLVLAVVCFDGCKKFRIHLVVKASFIIM
jgi:hypothetical protein